MSTKILASLMLACATFSSEAKALDIRNIDSNTQFQMGESKLALTSPTIRINTASSGGSGVIIGKNKDVYTLLTANHVIRYSQPSEIYIEIGSSQQVRPLRIDTPFKDIDLAAISFRTEKSLPIAFLPFLDKHFWSSIENWGGVKVEGYSNATNSVDGVTKRASSGQILTIAPGNKDGYDFVHTAVTNTGVSGGAIYGQPSTSITLAMSSILSDNPSFEVVKDLSAYVTRYEHTPEGIRHKRNGYIHDENNWEESEHYEIENIYYNACMNDQIKEDSKNATHAFLAKMLKNNQTRAQYKKFDCHSLAHQAQGVVGLCTIPAYAQPGEPRKPFENYLLAIHGRAEEYEYGGKSGAGLGVFLASPRISEWLRANSSNFGLIDKSGFYMSCRHKILLPDRPLR